MSAPRVRVFALLLLGCQPTGAAPFDGRVELFFRPEVGGSYFSCGETYQVGKQAVAPVDLHFYVYEVRLVTADGAEHPVEIDEEPPFQTGGSALLDFADGMSPCESDSVLNKTVKGTVDWDGEASDFTGIRFRLGTPAAGPDVFFHAASTARSVTLSNSACAGAGSCPAPNRPDIALDGFDVATSVIAVDWGALVDTSILSGCEDDGACGCASRCVPGIPVPWTSKESTSEPVVFRVE